MKNKLKKGLFLTTLLVATFALSACTFELKKQETKEYGNVPEVLKETDKNEVSEDKNNKVNKEEVIYDKDGIKVIYLGHKSKEDKFFGKLIDFKFDVRNDLNRDLDILADNVSADGRMINKMNYSMYGSIVSGKIGTATFTLNNHNGELPENIDELEFNLNIIDEDDYEFYIIIPVKIQTK